MKTFITLKHISILILMLFVSSLKANDTIVVQLHSFQIDNNNKLIVVNQDVNLINSTWPNLKSAILINNSDFIFPTPIDTIKVGIRYEILHPNNNQEYTLYFTELPIINITSKNEIVDEPRVLAHFSMIERSQKFITSNIGIEYRGGWSQTLDKKSFRIEFWNDTIGNKTKKISLLQMRSDDDWNLQAMTNEPLRLRNKTSHQLWKLIHKIYYSTEEPKAINGIQMEYAELFFNGEYRGLYCIGERIDRKQLKLKKYNGSIQGELYKAISWGGAVKYTYLLPYDNNSSYWDGFEYKYPDEIINWKNIYDAVDFVVNSTNEVFYENYQQKFHLDNIIDYFIFLNVSRALDNTGKNIYVAKYKPGEPYFFIPWDLDGTFGLLWDGTNIPEVNGRLSNGLYDRLWQDCYANGFRKKLLQRWADLRSNLLSETNIMDLFKANYNYLVKNGVYERESIAWSNYIFDEGTISYISNWLINRLKYLDNKISETCHPVSTIDNQNNNINVFPNPATDFLYITNRNNKPLDIKIYNLNGKLVKSISLKGNENSFPLIGLNNSLYFIHLPGDNINQVFKITIFR